ncbi:hypothetical protein [Hoeflea prorocentri]|uniref:DUF1127 domain-containing protein n=1 Tax=Hoeflea prorocentri TaxID=1922333 RepID=A0A9X3ZJ66_9HYPH|nr:hypothetical protein [Hoeflea prorocentri]MCY6382485.1 hypothetical protein [Hoeflea prorocentri]MDA5400285.1 hypothetical protein [Hoeflea prorocentri]
MALLRQAAGHGSLVGNHLHPKALAQRLSRLLRVIGNRRQIVRLEAFDDAQLMDIGLTRDDLRHALRSGLFHDPSLDLTRSALRRCDWRKPQRTGL